MAAPYDGSCPCPRCQTVGYLFDSSGNVLPCPECHATGGTDGRFKVLVPDEMIEQAVAAGAQVFPRGYPMGYRGRRDPSVAPAGCGTTLRKGAMVLVVVVVLIGGLAIYAFLFGDPGGEDDDVMPEPDEAPQLAVGGCLRGDLDAQQGIEAVGCGEPHAGEVFHTFVLPEPAETAEAFELAVLAGCGPAFEAYVGVPVTASSLEVVAVASGGALGPAGGGEVACAARSADGSLLEATVEASGQ